MEQGCVIQGKCNTMGLTQAETAGNRVQGADCEGKEEKVEDKVSMARQEYITPKDLDTLALISGTHQTSQTMETMSPCWCCPPADEPV